MATDNPTISYNGDFIETTYFYDGLDNGDDGAAIRVPFSAVVDFQVVGTFGSGGSINVEGSNKAGSTTDADYFILTDVHGNAATYTAAGGDAFPETPRWIRPHVTAGDGSTDLDVYLVVRRPTPKRQ